MEPRKRKRVLLVSVTVAVLVSAFWLSVLRNTGPTYEGRSLGFWVDQLEHHEYPVTDASRAQRAAAERAILSIGTNALPYLLKWISYEPPRWTYQLGRIAERLPDWMTGGNALNRLTYNSAAQARVRSTVEAFALLGEGAEPLLLNLEQLILRTNLPDTSSAALLAASSIGKAAVPAITNALRRLPPPVTPLAILLSENMGTNARVLTPIVVGELTHTNDSIAEPAAYAFVMVGPSNHFDDGILVPAMIRRFQGADPFERELALFVLQSFGARAAPALPALTNALSDPDPKVRTNVAAAIASITSYLED